jgi:hypothetical protein
MDARLMARLRLAISEPGATRTASSLRRRPRLRWDRPGRCDPHGADRDGVADRAAPEATAPVVDRLTPTSPIVPRRPADRAIVDRC